MYNASISITNGKLAAQQKRMSYLSRVMKTTGCTPSYFAQKFGVDGGYYKDWLSGDEKDLAELVVLYLPQSVQSAIESDLEVLSGLCH